MKLKKPRIRLVLCRTAGPDIPWAGPRRLTIKASRELERLISATILQGQPCEITHSTIDNWPFLRAAK